jgi:beta-galactosidase
MVGGSEPSLSKLGNATRDSLEGVHRAFFEEQIPVDFVHPMDVAGDKLNQYKIMFLPFPVMLSRNVAEGVQRYIRDGGTVVAEARLAWNDERGFSSDEVPGMGLAEVFGAREKVIRPVEKPEVIVEAHAGLAGCAPGTRAAATAFEEELEPLPGARVLARFADGAPAIVENSYGKGKAILVGTFLAMAYQRQHDEAAKQLLLGFARAAGIEPEVKVSGENSTQVEVRRLVGNDVQFLFAFNHSDHAAAAKISIRVPWPVREARSLNGEQKVSFLQSGDGLAIEAPLAAQGIWVVRLDRK